MRCYSCGMNIYRITKYHPAWMQYQLDFDYQFISRGVTSNPDQRKTLQAQVVATYMSDNGLSEETLSKIVKERTEKKIVHKLYGTD